MGWNAAKSITSCFVHPTPQSSIYSVKKVIMKKISLILAAVLCMSVQNVNAKKQYEGIWAQTTAECLDKESPNTRTLIDLSNKVKGKSLPIFDGYESHCKIIKSSGNDKNSKLKHK
jgi:hypothetical protein